MIAPDGAPLDDTDQQILDRLASLHGRVDPPPSDLDLRVQFAIHLEDLDAQVARVRADLLAAPGARDTERTRTITFDADSRTVMVTIVERPDGLLRLDGWLAPPAALPIELRLPEPAAPLRVTADQAGRFVFDPVPRGLAQLLVHPPEGGAQPRVVTPSLAL